MLKYEMVIHKSCCGCRGCKLMHHYQLREGELCAGKSSEGIEKQKRFIKNLYAALPRYFLMNSTLFWL